MRFAPALTALVLASLLVGCADDDAAPATTDPVDTVAPTDTVPATDHMTTTPEPTNTPTEVDLDGVDPWGALDEDGRPYAEALARSVPDLPTAELTDDDRRCAAATIVHAVGVDSFRSAGLEPAEIDETFDPTVVGFVEGDERQARIISDGFASCGLAVPLATLAAFDEIVGRGQLIDEELDDLAECVAAELDEESARDLLFLSFSNEPVSGGGNNSYEAGVRLSTIVRGCGVDAFVYP